MKDPLGVSPSKRDQGTTRGKENSFDLGGNRTHDRRGRGFDSHRGEKNFFFSSCGSLIPFTRAIAQWVFHGLHIALYFTQ